MKDNEEEDFDDHFPGNAGIGAFEDDIPMEEPEVDVTENDPSDNLGQALHNVQVDCESETERLKFQKLLEDHRELLYPDCQKWIEETWHHLGVAAMEGDKWCIQQGIW